MPNSEEAAVAAATALISGEPSVEAEETPSSEETVAEEPQETVALPSFQVELPEDLVEELEAPEFTETEEEPEDEWEDYGEDDPDERKRLRALEKERDYYKNLHLQKAQQKTRDEAKKFFPLAEPFLDEIKADSRRSYLRQAKAIHEKMAPIVEERVLAPAREVLEAERERIKQEAREEAERAWGRPASQTPPSAAEAVQEDIEKARRSGDFSDLVRAMIFPKGG